MIKNILAFIIMSASLTAYASDFQLTSASIVPGKEIDMSHVLNALGCKGQNISPQLSWNHAPSGTKSFAVTMYDPDALAEKGWWHWIVFNIPASSNGLDQDAGNPRSGKLPAGAVQGQNDFGAMEYGGPCPPSGDKPHRYVITVYALKNTLPVDANVSITSVNRAIKQYEIAAASITTRYHR